MAVFLVWRLMIILFIEWIKRTFSCLPKNKNYSNSGLVNYWNAYHQYDERTFPNEINDCSLIVQRKDGKIHFEKFFVKEQVFEYNSNSIIAYFNPCMGKTILDVDQRQIAVNKWIEYKDYDIITYPYTCGRYLVKSKNYFQFSQFNGTGFAYGDYFIDAYSKIIPFT